MTIKLLIKRLICKLGLGDRLTEFCEECGRQVPVYFRASDKLWLSVTGNVEGARCLECFDAACYRNGSILRWVPEVAHSRNVDGKWIENA